MSTTRGCPLMPRNQSIKIIAYKQPVHGVDIMSFEDLLWPCHSYDILVPIRKKNQLNIFEETILRLSEVTNTTPESMAETLCINKELVQFVQNRLMQSGYLDEQLEVTRFGKSEIDRWDRDFLTYEDYQRASIYRNLVTGQLMPYVEIEDLEFKEIESVEGSKIIFNRASSGKPIWVFSKKLKLKPEFLKVVPTIDDVIKTIQLSEKEKQHANVLSNQKVDIGNISLRESISITPTATLVYLHTRAFIPNGNPVVVSTDGFGRGYSKQLSHYINTLDDKWVFDLKEKGLVERYVDPSRTEKQTKHYRYPRIEEKLDKAFEKIASVKTIKIDSTSIEKELNESLGQGLIALYSALEWALYTAASEYDLEDMINSMNQNTVTEANILLRDMARQLGMIVPKWQQKTLKWSKGLIVQYQKGEAEMGTVLAMNIIGSKQYPLHRFKYLIEEHSEMLEVIQKLKAVRNPLSHGTRSEIDLLYDATQILYNQVMAIILCIVPNISTERDVDLTKLSNINQLHLKTRLTLERYFGIALVNDLSTNLRESLMTIEMVVDGQKITGQIDVFIINLTSCLQQCFFDKSRLYKHLGSEEDIKDQAVEKMLLSHLLKQASDLPTGIKTTNAYNVKAAVAGQPTSVTGNFLGYIVKAPQAELILLSKAIPDFVKSVAFLDQTRAHANNIKMMTPESLIQLKEDVFHIVKYVMEA